MAIIDKIQLSGTVYTIGNETTTAVTSASTDNEIPTAKAVYDAIPQGGGGKAIKAGRGISITSGETADTVSFNLPISAGTGANSIVMGEKATANGAWSFANGNGNILYGTSAGGERAIAIGYVCNANGLGSIANGQYCTANGIYSHAIGSYVNSYNDFETSIGKYNVSSSSNNTLFSVGNGTSNNARHNAFEIRKNGDIYITKNGQDVKLQDQLGGGGGKAVSGGTNISITTGETADTINCTLPISGDSKGIYNTSSYPFEGNSFKSNNIVFGIRNKINKNTSSAFCTDNLMFGADNNIGTGEYGYNNLKYNFVGGSNNKIYANTTVESSFIAGWYNEIRNSYETALGKYNVSHTGSTDADKTLFSVGNGADNARHNAFEIRQNGDIYLSSGGTDIKLQDHLGGGGGKAVSGGTNISITTGETADTINCTLNLENGTNSQSGGIKLKSSVAGNTVSGRDAAAFGGANSANGTNSFVSGFYNTGNTSNAFVSGSRNQTTNNTETLFGLWALSNGSRTGDPNGYSDATLLAVGNGEWRSQTRHNAFEIRQNGDIYVPNTDDTSTTNWYQKPMVRLQDTIAATAANTTALGGLSLVKLTQAEYDALATKDSNVLYVIVG